ncbi:MAG: gliding motility-associated C-terminal domain-containing protein [Chitinophagales bacterium]|nr:gliding motility-associated C-terminal domain-containing protein [Chitinophagales bacterium]
MRKIFVTLILGVLFCLNHMHGQFTVSMSSALVDRNANANVDVTVKGFTNLAGMQFSINYDSTVVEFVSFTNITTSIPDLAGGLAGPIGTSLKKGQIVVTWNNAGGSTLPDNSRLFTIVFKAIGSEGSHSDIVLSKTPRIIEVFDVDQKLLTVTGNKGTVTIKGTPTNTCIDPVCPDNSYVKIIGGTVSKKKGENVCVPISVRNFTNMISIQGSFNWDPNVLQYTNVKFPSSGGLPGFGGSNDYNDGKANQGKFSYLWSSDDERTLADNTIIMELCFNAIGNIGEVGCVEMSDKDVLTLWEQEGAGIVPLCYTYGKVTITDEDTDPEKVVTINTGSASGKKGDIVCVDVSVKNFTDIFSIETRFGWDPTQLKFIRTEGYNLDGLNSGIFNSSNNALSMAWTNGDAQTKPDNHVIFRICFELLCPNNNNYVANINILGPNEISGKVDGSSSPTKLNSQINGGSINVTCADTPDPVCSTGAITNATCNGSSDGSAAMTVTNGNACDYQWKTSSGTVIKSGAISAGNLTLTGVKAGSYSFSIICSGTVATTCVAIIGEPTVISIPTNAVVNESCGNKGQINISATSGGNGGYSYAWTPDQGNTANPTNLSAGTYSVVVTDSKGCTATQSFTITDAVAPLNVTITPTHVKCNGGDNGAATLSVTGGCPPYTYTWTGGLTGANPLGLRAGTYTVTVADGSNPANSEVKSVTITEPGVITSSVSNIKKPSTPSSTDGEITISISGGTPAFNTSWSGGLQGGATNGTQTVTNVGVGTYAVTVTDANGCSNILSNIIVSSDGSNEELPVIGTVSLASDYNGFGVKCFGDNNGIITGTITSGSFPMTVTLKSGNQTIGTPQVINTSTFTFNDLIAGLYTITVQNGAGSVTSANVRVTQPSKLAATVQIKCSDLDIDNGSIELNMNNTGAGNYGYYWQEVIDFDNKIENVGVGTYNVTVTDNNDCELRLSNLEVKTCDLLLGECYSAISIITPNGDNVNDLFLINCVKDNPGDLSVFDRWGRLVYSQLNYDNTWQGIDNDGKDLKEGGYIWVLTVNFGQGRKEIYKGTVTLLRGDR